MSFSVALALSKAKFVTQNIGPKINQPFAVLLPALHLDWF